MKVEQIYKLVNDITNEVTGKEDLLKEDLSNVVDVGNEVLDVTDIDNYVRKLVDRIAKVIFVDRKYKGALPSVIMDSWEYGAIVEKISTDLPEASENDSWKLEDKKSYPQDIFYQPKVEAKFFNNKVTFEIDMSFTEKQIKESFTSATELNAFISMIKNSIENSFTLKIDNTIMRIINNMIGETYVSDVKGTKAINLLKMYNEQVKPETPLKKDVALSDGEFLKFATMYIKLTTDRLTRMSTIYNIGSKQRFTPKEDLHLIFLSDFNSASETYLLSTTYHNDLVKLPSHEVVPYWQGSGVDFNFNAVSSINIKTSTGHDVELDGIIGVAFDRNALGVSNLGTRVTTNFNAKAEFWNSFYKMEMGCFNDTNENFIVFYIGDEVEKKKTKSK